MLDPDPLETSCLPPSTPEVLLERKWTLQDSRELYLISRWGTPYFNVNDKGHMTCAPRGSAFGTIDIKDLVDNLCQGGTAVPLLIRFNDILGARIDEVYRAFRNSIDAYGYKASYRGVMPIKVNQQRHVVEELVRHGARHNLGLEAGSKPELLAAIALLEGDDNTLICNGYKDSEYVETALYAQKIGVRTYIVLDRFAELALILAAARKTGIRPRIGIRAKLSARGSGRWKSSSGDRSKFGLSAREMVKAVEQLRDAGFLDTLELLHFHIGSQITSIRSLKDALREAMHLYCNLRAMGATQLSAVDCGGGLAIDYDGSRTDFHSSMNYSTQEYANDVVSILQAICDGRRQPHPDIVTESGRALIAHHSLLVFNVLGTHEVLETGAADKICAPGADDHEILGRMFEALSNVNRRNFQEIYNDITEMKEEIVTLFGHGIIDLRTRARGEEMFWATSRRVAQTLHEADFVPEDLRSLKKELSDTYYCNFSVFQSLPDAWAIGHLFPIAPLQRLDEEPTREAILADLTCDSDGKIDKFIDLRNVRDTLRLHAPNGKPYYLGAFLVGAYQEILGDLHNLFGDTNAVHVSLDEHGGYRLEHQVAGDSVSDVLGYVEYDPKDLIRRVESRATRAVARNALTAKEMQDLMSRYQEGLGGYTYLEDID